MATYLRRCVSLGAKGVDVPGSEQDYRYFNNPTYFSETDTSWVRIWAFWPKLQPDPAYGVDHPGSPAYSKFVAFDDQINQARAAGRNILIVSYQFPTWANGTSQYAAPGVYDTPTEISFGKEDRMKQADWLAYYNNGAYNGPKPKRKQLEFKVPTDLGPSSYWGNWISFLINRYRDFADGRVVAIEIVNEPNGQMWPLFNPNSGSPWSPGSAGDLAMDCSVASMMNTAKAISNSFGDPGYLMAPSTDDGLGPATPKQGADGSTRLRVRYDTFTNQLLGRLDSLNFAAHPKFCWSHHNYIDVEHDIGEFSNTPGGTGYLPRACDVRNRLVNRWSGWPQFGGQKNNPYVFLTEGGARSQAILSLYPGVDWKQKQKDLVKNQWQRHHQDVGNGVGIGMITNYLFSSDAGFDSGLRDIYPATTARPSYDYWNTLPFIP